MTRDEIHGLLERAEVCAIESIPWSSNYTFAARLTAEGYPDFLAVYKPRRGEIPLWDFPDGTLYKRERAAYLTAVAFGWDFVPPTVIRDGPHGVGSFQLLVDVEPRSDYFKFKDAHTAEVQCIGLFDVVINNADRKAGHCLLGEDGRIHVVDHGVCFSDEPKLRTVIWDHVGEPIEAAVREDLARLADEVVGGSVRDELANLLAEPELAALAARSRAVSALERFPEPGPDRRPFPWPPI